MCDEKKYPFHLQKVKLIKFLKYFDDYLDNTMNRYYVGQQNHDG